MPITISRSGGVQLAEALPKVALFLIGGLVALRALRSPDGAPLRWRALIALSLNFYLAGDLTTTIFRHLPS
ncbi:MAG: hypothetical protein AAF517_11315 [Planctomycetota bacterium]